MSIWGYYMESIMKLNESQPNIVILGVFSLFLFLDVYVNQLMKVVWSKLYSSLNNASSMSGWELMTKGPSGMYIP